MIINPTGGYKGAVPFIATVGMLFGKKIVYMFESSKQLLTLPPLPVTFDLNLFHRALPAIKHVENQTFTSKWEYFGRISNFSVDEENLFLSYVEDAGEGLVTLSPLAFALYKLEDNREVPKILPEIVKDLQNDNSESACQLKRMIGHVSSPLWRNMHIHKFEGTDLLVFKINLTAERIAGFLKGNEFYVTHAFKNHQTYEAAMFGARKSDYLNREYAYWPIEQPELEESATRERVDLISQLGERADFYKEQIEELTSELAATRERL